MQPWLKLAALILVVAALGLPINDLFRYALLVIATVLVVAGTVSAQLAPWLAALAAVALCVLGQIMFPAPRIEEGHNVFLIDDSSISAHSRESGNPRLRVPGERSETRDPETQSAALGPRFRGDEREKVPDAIGQAAARTRPHESRCNGARGWRGRRRTA